MTTHATAIEIFDEDVSLNVVDVPYPGSVSPGLLPPAPVSAVPAPLTVPTSTLAQQLIHTGLCLFPCFNLHETAHRRQLFMDHLASLPEFKPAATDYAYGGFSGINMASSLHHPTIRQLRAEVHARLLLFFKTVAIHTLAPVPCNLEQLFDRALYRIFSKQAATDTVHRDECTLALPGDYILGGWLNLDSTTQTFSCLPGSHLLGVNPGGGFAKIKDKEEIKHYNQHKQRVDVPPGHLLLFFENIKHDVCATPVTNPLGMARLFFGWRLTDSTIPLIPNILSLIDQEALIPLKSGQILRMYPVLAWTNWGDKLQAWTLRFINPECTTRRTYTSGKRKGDTLTVPILYAGITPALCEERALLGLPPAKRRYAPYTLVEKQIYLPTSLI